MHRSLDSPPVPAGGSFNGRTNDSDSFYLGSNPSPPANPLNWRVSSKSYSISMGCRRAGLQRGDQMVLAMARPTKHPKSGTYMVRLAIPAALGETCKRLFGVRAEFRENLGTKDSRQATARLSAKLEKARAALGGGPALVTDRDIAALAGDCYRDGMAARGDNPAPWEAWNVRADSLYDQIEPRGSLTMLPVCLPCRRDEPGGSQRHYRT